MVTPAELRKLQGHKMSEADLQSTVLDACRRLKLRVAHFHPARLPGGRVVTPVSADGAGFPDLVIVGRHGVLFRELKGTDGRLSPEQRAWITDLHEAGHDVEVWRPKDWIDGRILAQLRVVT